MKNALRILLPILILAAGASAAAILMAMRPKVEPASAEILPPLVEATRARAERIDLQVEAQGTVVPRTESRLTAEVSARVLEVSPAWVDGGFFEEGEVLLRLDPTDYRLAEEEAAARVARDELRLAQEEADAEIARRDWQAERGAEEPPPLAVHEPQLAEARTALSAARGALEKARRDVERCTVVAPYPGRVLAKGADRGEHVQRGAELGRIYAVDFAEVRLPLPDSELAFLELPLAWRDGEANGDEGTEVVLRARFAGKDHRWTGRVVRTEAELDPASRMVVVVARVPDPYGRGEMLDRPPLMTGMFVQASIRGRSIPDAIALPRSALRGGNRVFVLDQEGRLRVRVVDVLRTERERVLVRGGLEAAEQVIISPMEEAVDGMRVRLPAGEGDSR